MGKTITTYLMTGDPKGAQYVLTSNRVCKMIMIYMNIRNHPNQ